jgi:hypothetical protein
VNPNFDSLFLLFINNNVLLISLDPPGIIAEHENIIDASWRVFDEYWIVD